MSIFCWLGWYEAVSINSFAKKSLASLFIVAFVWYELMSTSSFILNSFESKSGILSSIGPFVEFSEFCTFFKFDALSPFTSVFWYASKSKSW